MYLSERIALRAIELINQQIADGIDIDGKKYKYSEKPFAMPYSSKVVKAFGKDGKGKYYNVTSKNGKRWLIITKGYKSYREAFNREVDKDFLQWSGNMLAAIDVINYDTYSAEIGFRNKKAAQIAYYLNVSGAGRGRKLWKFFGLTKENIDKLMKLENISELEINTLIDSLFK